jgi:hypothetical protein
VPKSKVAFLFGLWFFAASLANACQASSPHDVLPQDVQGSARSIWTNYSQGLSGASTADWRLKSGDESKPFAVTSAKQGNLPTVLQMQIGSAFQTDVWCVSFQPPLYSPDEKVAFQNMLLLHLSNGNWWELGSLWTRPWKSLLYDPGVVPPPTYYGTTKHVFEMMGCDNFTGSDDAAGIRG